MSRRIALTTHKRNRTPQPRGVLEFDGSPAGWCEGQPQASRMGKGHIVQIDPVCNGPYIFTYALAYAPNHCQSRNPGLLQAHVHM